MPGKRREKRWGSRIKYGESYKITSKSMRVTTTGNYLSVHTESG